jgi:hypothetical protein
MPGADQEIRRTKRGGNNVPNVGMGGRPFSESYGDLSMHSVLAYIVARSILQFIQGSHRK